MPLAPGFLAIVRPEGTASPPRSRPRPTGPSRIDGPSESGFAAKIGGGTVYLSSLASGAAISVAWWFPETLASALLGWVAAVLLIVAVRARRSYLPAYCCGLVTCSMGFYWIYRTVAVYGGFGAGTAALVFALFVVVSAVQFLLFAFLHHNLGPVFDAYALRSPTALVLSEFISIRLFHWHYGHTQIAFTPFVQVADLGGAMLVSFLMFWLAEAGVRAIVFQERRRAFLLPVLFSGLSLGYGFVMIRTFSAPDGPRQEVILIQGNSSLNERLDLDLTRRNVARLHELSRKAARANALIVWAEGAIPAFLPAEVGSVSEEPVLPWIGDGSAFLVGAYAMDRRERRYNSAFAVHPDGRVPLPYFKQILIPFGEYMPGASFLPWLKGLNAGAGVFSPGTEVKVFDYPMHRQDGTAYTLKVSPLICYEDTVPSLSNKAARQGAQLLVNLTYDTWFGRSAAPFEHHLIAAFRAIENRRFLVRATNSGQSGVVDPLGRTIAQLPVFAQGTLSASVVLIDHQTIYARFVRDRPWWVLLAVSLVVVIENRRRRARPGAVV